MSYKLPPLLDVDLRDVGTKAKDIREFLSGYATAYAIAAIEAQGVPDVDDLRDSLVAISSAVAHSDNREAQALIRMTLERLASAPLAPQAKPQPVQPSDCEWTNCPRRVGDVCCNVCPGLAAQPEKDPLADDLFSVLFEVEQAIGNGSCPWQIEAAFEAYEAARRLQLPDHGIAAPQPKD